MMRPSFAIKVYDFLGNRLPNIQEKVVYSGQISIGAKIILQNSVLAMLDWILILIFNPISANTALI
jgi:hypothetical protein